ncbi:MAG: uracil-DNA glycosylase [Planctomycetota bacterium]
MNGNEDRPDLAQDIDALYVRIEAEIAAGIDRIPVGVEPADAPRVSLPAGGKKERLSALEKQAEACRACPLHEQRNRLVFGAGDPESRLMFVGEAPGPEEDREGLPFVGRAGQLLTKMIEAMGYTRDTVYIANLIKCHPAGDRTPSPAEIAACRGFLESQIMTLSPTVIVALGAPAAKTLLDRDEDITSLRGRLFPYGGDHSITIIPTFHPTYLLHNESEKGKVWQDLQKAMALLQKA